MGLNGLNQLILNRHQRVQAGLRVLKDHRNAIPADLMRLGGC